MGGVNREGDVVEGELFLCSRLHILGLGRALQAAGNYLKRGREIFLFRIISQQEHRHQGTAEVPLEDKKSLSRAQKPW